MSDLPTPETTAEVLGLFLANLIAEGFEYDFATQLVRDAFLPLVSDEIALAVKR